MRRTIVILLILVAAAALVSLHIITAQPQLLRVGTKLKDPRSHFVAQVQTNHRGIGRLMGRSIEASEEVFICRTQYRFRPNHKIAVRSYTYRFDTNSTLISINSEWKWYGDF